MPSVLLVLPREIVPPALPERLRQALANADVQVLGQADCRTMVQAVREHAPRQVLVYLSTFTNELSAALDAWSGAPPCALSLACPPLDSGQHAALVALGVHAWSATEELDAASMLALLARAQARWQRETALRDELADARSRLDERKWIERAKGLLMSVRGLGEDEAFGLLRGAAMHANLRLGDVSRSVIEAAQWAEAINRAGQLRMLSQRLARLAAQALAGVDARRSRVLRSQSAERVQANLDHLATLELREAPANALATARTQWTALAAALESRMSPAALEDIDVRAEAFLDSAETLTAALEVSAARRALRIVNLCGRQRMRAQRLAKDALLVAVLQQVAARVRLTQTMKDFEAALLELEESPLRTPQIRDALTQARDEWLRLVAGVHNADSNEGRTSLVRASDTLVDIFDQLTAAYERSLQVIMS